MDSRLDPHHGKFMKGELAMDETAYQTAFQIILHAGNSKSKSMMALQKAASGEIEEAERLICEADADLIEAHHVQTDLIMAEASGIKAEVNIIMVHAQDHLSMATVMKDVASEMIRLYKRLDAKTA